MNRRQLLVGAGAVWCAAATPSFARALTIRDRIAVETLGSGPDVVLMPGYASSRETWRETAARLAPRHRVHLLQVRGFADLEAPAEKGPVWSPVVADIAAYLRTLQKPAFIGHSMGGATGLRLAIEHPGVASKILVADSLPFYATLFNAAATVDSVRPIAQRIAAQIRNADAAQFAAAQAQSAAILAKSPAARERIVAWSVASDRETIAVAIEELMTTDLRPHLAAIATPVTVAFAWDAAMGRPADVHENFWRTQYASLKTARLDRVDDSFHFLMDDQPARTATVIDAFLAEA